MRGNSPFGESAQSVKTGGLTRPPALRPSSTCTRRAHLIRFYGRRPSSVGNWETAHVYLPLSSLLAPSRAHANELDRLAAPNITTTPPITHRHRASSRCHQSVHPDHQQGRLQSRSSCTVACTPLVAVQSAVVSDSSQRRANRKQASLRPATRPYLVPIERGALGSAATMALALAAAAAASASAAAAAVTAMVAAASSAVAAAAIVMAMVVGSAMTAVVTVATQGSAKVEAEQVTATVAVQAAGCVEDEGAVMEVVRTVPEPSRRCAEGGSRSRRTIPV